MKVQTYIKEEIIMAILNVFMACISIIFFLLAVNRLVSD